MKGALPLTVLAGCLAVGVLPAFAANQAVTINDGSFSPSRVAVKPGETVTWTGNTLNSHNVHFEGEFAPLGAPSQSFSASRQFDAEGEFRYFCDVHATMRGRVFVNATGTLPATPTPSATPTASASPPPSGGGGGGATTTPVGGSTPPASGTTPAEGTTSPAVAAFRARATRRSFCARRSATCRRPGVFLTLTLDADEAVRVRGTLRRSGRRVRRVTLLARPGRQRVKLPGRALRAGRYALTLRAGELTRTVRFRVRR